MIPMPIAPNDSVTPADKFRNFLGGRQWAWTILLTWISICLPIQSVFGADIRIAIDGKGRFTDQSGRSFTVVSPFKRIISLYGAHTENLFALGLEDQLIGVGRNELYPPAASQKPTFSYRDDAEKFLAAGPDLILVRPMITRAYPQLFQRLEQSGITVVSMQPADMTEMYDYWRVLGLLSGKSRRAEEMITSFQTAMTAFKDLNRSISPHKRVYLEAIHDKMKTFTPDAMAAVVLNAAGGKNIAQDARQVRRTNLAFYGKERILSKGEQIDVYLAQFGAMNRPTIEMIRKEPGFHIIKAVRENQIHLIDEAIISRPTPRLLLGVFTMGNILYPDQFPRKGYKILQTAGLTPLPKEVPH